jgi:hypothetical protein
MAKLNVTIFTLCIISKARKDLVDGSQDWAHSKFYLLELQFQEQRLEELHKEQKLEKHGPTSCNTLDGIVSESKTKVGSTSL